MTAYERIIGETNDLQSASFLARGARAERNIGRISEVAGGGNCPSVPASWSPSGYS